MHCGWCGMRWCGLVRCVAMCCVVGRACGGVVLSGIMWRGVGNVLWCDSAATIISQISELSIHWSTGELYHSASVRATMLHGGSARQ